MQLLVQPDDGIAPILDAIEGARKTIDMHIFRIDRRAIEKALAAAVKRGVVVRTLIAHTANNAEEALRKLEQRLLAIGATVSRSADDLVRYHGKMMVVDRKTLYVLGYNLTRADIDKSRSLGISTRKPELVREALTLFDADFDRKAYKGNPRYFVVSPVNSRDRLGRLIKGARKQLLIYCAQVSDNALIKLLEARAKAGVDVRIIGKIEKGHTITAEKYAGQRLHVRAVVRDGRWAFVGSQGLRRIELDARREIGVIVKHPGIVKRIVEIFEADWAATQAGKKEKKDEKKEAKREAKEEKKEAKEERQAAEDVRASA
jgi:phosphatidylserine/phosphatidylglycerophosphate/cardiolipin synthase-like enzyme